MLLVLDARAKAFTDPDTGAPLPTCEHVCEKLTEPTHMVRFGRHTGYLTKYLTKSIGQAAGLDERAIAERQRWHAEYTAAQLTASGLPPDNRSATTDHAA